MLGEKRKNKTKQKTNEPQQPSSSFTIKEQLLYLHSLFRELYTVYGYSEN